MSLPYIQIQDPKVELFMPNCELLYSPSRWTCPKDQLLKLPSRHFCILNNSAQQRKIFWWVLECFDNLELITFYNAFLKLVSAASFIPLMNVKASIVSAIMNIIDNLRQSSQNQTVGVPKIHTHPTLIPWIELHQYLLCTSLWEVHSSRFVYLSALTLFVSLASWYSAW